MKFAKSELTYLEVHHLYKQLKDEESGLRSELTDKKLLSLTKKCWTTLKHVMQSLMLANEYDILHDSYQQKQSNGDDDKSKKKKAIKTPKAKSKKSGVDILIKLLLRCREMYDSKERVQRIIKQLYRRQELIR